MNTPLIEIKRLRHQRKSPVSADRQRRNVDRHSGWIVPVLTEHRTLGRRCCEPRIGVCCLVPGLRCPLVSAPVDGVLARFVNPFPQTSHRRSCAIGEDTALVERAHGHGIGAGAGARRDAEETGFRIDRVQSTILARSASRRCRRRCTRTSSREWSAAAWPDSSCASRGKGRRDVKLSASRIRQTQNQHVLRHPTFPPRHGRAMRSARHFLPSNAFPP